MTNPQNINLISDLEQLHAINGMPHERTLGKIRSTLDSHSTHLIQNSAFFVLATNSDPGIHSWWCQPEIRFGD
jgi:hypothetical protein